MKRVVLIPLILCFMTAPLANAQAGRSDAELFDALTLAKNGRYAEASKRLFQLSYSPRYADKRMQIKYILGMSLFQMKLNQIAAFQFIGVVKEGNNKYIKQSLERLSIAADALGDDTLLNYAISRVNVDEFPRAQRDMLNFRIGEYQLRNKQFESAAQSFAKVNRSSGMYNPAKYQEGLAYAEAGKAQPALAAFDELIQAREAAPVNDRTKVAAMMGKARVYYQKKAWDEAIEAYRQIPRDSDFWHSMVFESSWAMLRSGRFRSAISNFQSLHSAFYEDYFLPESLLLRSITYLYICKYDEMDKVLNLFSQIYKPVYQQLESTLQSGRKPIQYFTMINDIMKMNKAGRLDKMSLPIPYIVANKITREADFQSAFQYIRKLVEEKQTIRKMPGGWANSPVGQYSTKVLNTRIQKAKERAGKIIRNHLLLIRDELIDQIEQEGFARYEMLNGRKETLKKKIAGKELSETPEESSEKRDYYIQNGYEYWPFRGEYWLDELGNYHYVGTQSCN